VREDEGLWGRDATLENAHALGGGRGDLIPLNEPGWGGPDRRVGGGGSASMEDELDGVDCEEDGSNP